MAKLVHEEFFNTRTGGIDRVLINAGINGANSAADARNRTLTKQYTDEAGIPRRLHVTLTELPSELLTAARKPGGLTKAEFDGFAERGLYCYRVGGQTAAAARGYQADPMTLLRSAGMNVDDLLAQAQAIIDGKAQALGMQGSIAAAEQSVVKGRR
jgi:hypothetical protein